MAECTDKYRGKYAGKYALCAEGKEGRKWCIVSNTPHKPAPYIGYQPPQRYRYTSYTTPHRSPLSSHISYTPFDAGNLKYGLQRKICDEQDRHTPYDRVYVFSLFPADLGNTICNEPGGNTV